MACIVHGISYEDLPGHVVIGGGINTNSPRLLDGPMAGGLIELARAGQPVIVTPFTLAGAMAPVTVIGAITQQNAEALAGIVLTQLVRPGVPTVYGGFTSNVAMRTGSPAFGTRNKPKRASLRANSAGATKYLFAPATPMHQPAWMPNRPTKVRCPCGGL